MNDHKSTILDRAADASDIPVHVADWSDIPHKLHPIYEDDAKGGYSITGGGRQLLRVRRAMKEPVFVLPPARKGSEPKVGLQDWCRTLACAKPAERKVLIAQAATGQIRVER